MAETPAKKRKRRRMAKLQGLESMPVRSCTTSCRHRKGGRKGCDLFIEKKVKDGDDCLVEVRRINEWSFAYEEGDVDLLKSDAGKLMGSTYVMAMRMMEQIVDDGLTLTAPSFDRHGEPLMFEDQDRLDENGNPTMQMVYVTKAHPLWDPFMKIVRSLGMDLKDFGLTPGKKAAEQSVRGMIGEAENVNVQVVIMEQAEQIESFKRGLAEASKHRSEDPVFQRFAGIDTQEEMKRLDRKLAIAKGKGGE